MRSPDGLDIWCRGVVIEGDPPRRLASTTSFSNEAGNLVDPLRCGMPPDFPAESIVTVTFDERENKTALILRHGIPETMAEQVGANVGWGETLDRLAEYLVRGEGGRP